jgi:hypothetical protein
LTLATYGFPRGRRRCQTPKARDRSSGGEKEAAGKRI